MKTTISKEFFEKWKNKKVVMWCKKEEYAEEFCKIMDENSFKWSSNNKYSEETYWRFNKGSMCYEFNEGSFAGKEWYKDKDYTILDFEDYIIKEKMNKEELVELLITNFVDEEGVLDLSGLDFTKFECDVDISYMNVAGRLFQANQKVEGDLFQNTQEASNVFQSAHKVSKSIFQDIHVVGDSVFEGNHNVDSTIYNHQETEIKTPKSKRYYLNKININPHFDGYKTDERQPVWQGQQQIYGFDETDTWNLNSTMLFLLYERVCMYRDKSDVDTDFYKKTYKNKTLTQKDIIDTIIVKCEFIFMVDKINNNYSDDIDFFKKFIKDKYNIKNIDSDLNRICQRYETDIWNLWNIIKQHMWW